MTAETITRADEIRRYVELDALSRLVRETLGEYGEPSRLAEYGGNTGTRPSFRSVSWEAVQAATEPQDLANGELTATAAHSALWEYDVDDYEASPEWQRAQTRSSLLAASLFTWLASNEGREFCLRAALRCHEGVDRGLTHA